MFRKHFFPLWAYFTYFQIDNNNNKYIGIYSRSWKHAHRPHQRPRNIDQFMRSANGNKTENSFKLRLVTLHELRSVNKYRQIGR